MSRRLSAFGAGLTIAAGLAVAGLFAPWSHHDSASAAVTIHGEALAVSVSNNGKGNGNGNSPPPANAVSIGGSRSGLYPGGTLPLTLTFGNPKPFAITVNQIVITSGDASSSCKASNLQVGGIPNSVSVPGNSTATTIVQVTLLKVAPNSCEGAIFPLSYSAEATKS